MIIKLGLLLLLMGCGKEESKPQQTIRPLDEVSATLELEQGYYEIGISTSASPTIGEWVLYTPLTNDRILYVKELKK